MNNRYLLSSITEEWTHPASCIEDVALYTWDSAGDPLAKRLTVAVGKLVCVVRAEEL